MVAKIDVIHRRPPACVHAATPSARAVLLACLLACHPSTWAQDAPPAAAAGSTTTASEASQQLASLLSRSDLSMDKIGEIGGADPMPPHAQATLWRVFRFLRRLPSQIRITAVDVTQAAQPTAVDAKWQGQLLTAIGQLQRITPCALPADLQDSFGTADFFRCEVRLAGINAAAVVYALQVPQPLLEVVDPAATVGPQVSLTGLVTHVAADDTFPITMVADKLLWRPQTPEKSLGIDARHVWLAAQGVDVVDLRGVTDKSALTARDFASFYQLLSAARLWDDHQLMSQHPQWLQLGSVLQQPSAHRGSLLRVRGMARRIRLIATEPDVAARFDVQQYYEIALLTEVDPPIRIEAGDQSRMFSRYPVVACVTSLPDGMPTGDVLEPIEFTGVFLKAWAYPTAWLSGADARYRQLSPLFIARQPTWLASADERETSSAATLLGWLALGTMLVLIAFAWQVARWNRQSLRQRRQAAARGEPLNLDDLDLDV